MDDIRRAFDMCNHTRCTAAREELIFHRMPQRGIYRRCRRYRILPEAKYIDPFYPRSGTHPTGWNPPVEWTWFVPTGKPCFPFIEPCQFGGGGGTAHRPFPTDSSNIIPFNQPLNYNMSDCRWREGQRVTAVPVRRPPFSAGSLKCPAWRGTRSGRPGNRRRREGGWGRRWKARWSCPGRRRPPP